MSFLYKPVKPVKPKRKNREFVKASRKKIKTLQETLIPKDGEIIILHAGYPTVDSKVGRSEKKEENIGLEFTMLSPSESLYTVKVIVANYNQNKNEPDIVFKCNCGEKDGIVDKNNCKHIGKFVSAMLEQFVKNSVTKKKEEKIKIVNKFANLHIN
jgi:hypothetical protein